MWFVLPHDVSDGKRKKNSVVRCGLASDVVMWFVSWWPSFR